MNTLHCVLDCSASMNVDGKLRQCVGAFAGIRLGGERLSDIFPKLPPARLWLALDEVREFDPGQDIEALPMSLLAFKQWLAELGADGEKPVVLFFSDGLFDREEALKFAEDAQLDKISLFAIAAGADSDPACLELIARPGRVYTLSELGQILKEIAFQFGAPDISGIEAALEPPDNFQNSAPEEPEDEDDDWE